MLRIAAHSGIFVTLFTLIASGAGCAADHVLPEAVGKLVSVVRDAETLAAARGDRSQLFFALPIRNGNISEAAAVVLKQNQQSQAVKALLQVVSETRIQTDILNQTTCANAVRALGQMGSAAKSAIPTLKELASSNDQFVRSEVEQALKRIG